MTQLKESGTVLRTMLMIRLQRVGRRNHAEFRVVVTEKARAAKSSNYKELIGNYNPHTDEFNVNEERIKHWMSVGAKTSDTLHNLLVGKGIIKGKKINVLPRKSPIQKEEKEAEAAAPETTKDTEEAKLDEAVKEAAEVAKDEEPADNASEETKTEEPEEKKETEEDK